MRFATLIVAALALAACASSIKPVPETGAFGVKYVEIDGDYFVKVEKVGVSQAVTVMDSNHSDRGQWKRRDWEAYADTLFPADELSFEALRQLRGSNLVPGGLVSPTPKTIPPCDTTNDPTYAKQQTRTVRLAKKRQRLAGDVTMVTTCLLHKGLSPGQYEGIHKRPNPYRFPTRYETIIDLDRDDKAEQRNVRIRNVKKAMVVEFLKRETSIPKKVRQQLELALDRM
ncbi:hypothetical protein HK107_15040 [Parvularcula sp. ZS-1/3]|uniref:Lipoprotein n=1 Tax=Parvularcula mediterranea TaxID=2732508 RepID=A0A7Y3W6U4_9PROT|nr:hypothetical protein [Parvularcula mediterranea]NNU17646.1 hypothetical protein [Parvularcula mediterranea]